MYRSHFGSRFRLRSARADKAMSCCDAESSSAMLEMKGVNIAPVGPPAELNVVNDYKLMTEGIRIARLEGLVDKLLREVDPKGVNIGPAGLLPPASEHSVESENNKVTSEGSRILHLEALVENLVPADSELTESR